MVPKYSERRHRLPPDEIIPVHDAALVRLRKLVEARNPSAFDEASSLFRVWARISRHVCNKPVCPSHGSWEMVALQLPYGTECIDAVELGRTWESPEYGYEGAA